jgi:hypothetical protein
MVNLGETIVGASSLIEHGQDFAFRKNNGEIANKLREDFSGAGRFAKSASLQEIFIDEEDDIGVRTDKGTWYLTPNSISIVGWPVRLKDLSAQGCLDELALMTQTLFEGRKILGAQLFSIRLFFLPSHLPGPNLTAFANAAYAPLRSLLGKRTLPDGVASRFLTTFRVGNFESTLELELQEGEMQLRYTREAAAQHFRSYPEFLEQVQLGEMGEDLRVVLGKVPLETPPALSAVQ